MKKLAYLFQKGSLKQKIALTVLAPLITTLTMYLFYSLVFFVIAVLGGASFLVSTVLGLAILLVAIMVYPARKDINEYSDYSRKYL